MKGIIDIRYEVWNRRPSEVHCKQTQCICKWIQSCNVHVFISEQEVLLVEGWLSCQPKMYGEQENKFEQICSGHMGTNSRSPPVNKQTDRHDWKHYLPATLFACGNYDFQNDIVPLYRTPPLITLQKTVPFYLAYSLMSFKSIVPFS